MKVCNMILVMGIALLLILVMGIALLLSVSKISADTEVSEDHPNYPKILPSDLPFDNTSSGNCSSKSDCGWIIYKPLNGGIAFSSARIACDCASGEQCEHNEDLSRTYFHRYKCV